MNAHHTPTNSKGYYVVKITQTQIKYVEFNEYQYKAKFLYNLKKVLIDFTKPNFSLRYIYLLFFFKNDECLELFYCVTLVSFQFDKNF